MPRHSPSPHPLSPPRRTPHLAQRAAARHAGAVRRRAGGDARRGGASGLCADRHDPRDRTLAPSHPVHAHPGLPARRPPAGASGRQKRVRILGARARLHPRPRLPPLRPAHAAGTAEHVALVRRGGAEGHAQGDAPPEGRAAHHPRHRRRRAGGEASPLGEPQAVEAGAAGRLPHGSRHHFRAGRHAEDLRLGRPAFRLGACAAAGDRARRYRNTCSTARSRRRAS